MRSGGAACFARRFSFYRIPPIPGTWLAVGRATGPVPEGEPENPLSAVSPGLDKHHSVTKGSAFAR